MKRLSLLLTLILAASARLWAAAVNDTIVDVDAPQRVVVTTGNDTLMNIEITGSRADSSYRFTYARFMAPAAAESVFERGERWDFSELSIPLSRHRSGGRRHRSGEWDLAFSPLHFGFVGALGTPQGMSTDMLASKEIMVGPLSFDYKTPGGRNAFRVGVGFTFRSFRMTGRRRFGKVDGNVALTDYPEGAEIDFSRIKVKSTSFVLGYERLLKRHSGIGVYAILNRNRKANLKTRYVLDGEKRCEIDKHINQRPVTVDFMLEGHCRWVGLYVKYSPCSVLRTDFGPQFSSLSTGLTFFW